MNKMKGSTRKYLLHLAHDLKPVIMVGKSGITENIITRVDDALNHHELIKIKFVDFKEEKEPLSAEIAEKTRSGIVGRIGHVTILYREHPDPEKRKIHIPTQ